MAGAEDVTVLLNSVGAGEHDAAGKLLELFSSSAQPVISHIRENSQEPFIESF